MKLYKQQKPSSPAYKTAPWWCDFTVDGKRYRLSLDTANKPDARKAAEKKQAAALEGKLSASSHSFARLLFPEAADKYLATRKLELQASSLTKERQLLVKLKEYFGASRLSSITSEQILSYREWRAESCGPALINMEIGVLRRILKRGKLWAAVADDIKPLREPDTIGKALSPEQKQALLAAAAERPEWQTAYFATVLALNTTMRGAELKGLRWSDIDFVNSTLTIQKSKTAAGQRMIPLTPDAFEVLAQLRARAELFGAVVPEHFVFARFKPVGQFNGREIVGHRMLNYDPTTPIGSWKKAWSKLKAKAGLKDFRFHDMRHTSITTLCESGASEQTIKAIAGHVSNRMLERYSHIRLAAKRDAIGALATREHAERTEHLNTLNSLNLNMNEDATEIPS